MPDEVKPSPQKAEPASASARENTPAPLALLPLAAFTFYVVVMLRMAWVADDAFITLRALDNLIHGYGLVSNPPERVLGFTNPLWAGFLVVPLALGANAYWAALGCALVVSIAAAYWLARTIAPDARSSSIALLFLALSAAYVDFSTSGLENPLAHLLLAIFFGLWFTGRLDPLRITPWLLAALIAWNRMDHVLLVAPALASSSFQTWRAAEARGRALRKLARAAVLGALPLLAWLGFAIVYYGFPFPNTAYAKLNTDVATDILARQGIVYLLDSIKRDPLTLIVCGLACACMLRERSRLAFAVLGGVLLYFAYLIRIGGDFMTGRFLTAPFFVCVLWLAARVLPRAKAYEAAGIAIGGALLGLLFSTSFVSNEKLECAFDSTGIANERECYMQYTGLTYNVREQKYKEEGRWQTGEALRNEHRRVSVESNVGMTGFAAGPDVHVIDLLALTDPLLARIPFRPDGNFRIGHFHRDEPFGYSRSVRSGHNKLADPCLHAYYDVLSLVIDGPIWSRARFAAIWDLNRGRYDYLMRKPCPLPKRAPRPRSTPAPVPASVPP